MHHVSASQIDTFRDCRRKWWFTSVLGIRPPASPSAALGTAVHEAIEAAILHGTALPDTHAGTIATAAMPYTHPRNETPLVELDMATSPANRRTLAGVAVHGRIDIFAPNLSPPLVQDWKTTSDFKWSKNEAELRWNAQAILYSRFALDYLAHHYGRIEQLVRFQHVNLLTKGKPTARVVAVDLTAEHIDAEWARLDSLVASMVDTATATKPSDVAPTESACSKFGGCFFRERCAALKMFSPPLRDDKPPDSHMPSQEDGTMSTNPAMAALKALQSKKRNAAESAAAPPAAPPAAPATSTSGARSEIAPPDAGSEDLSLSPLAWTGEARFEFEERAAIREHEGKQPRSLAESAAAKDVRKSRATAPAAPPVEAAPPAAPVVAAPVVAAPPPPVAIPIDPPPPVLSTSGSAAEGSVPVRAPLVLYIDCYPMRGVPAILHLEDYLAPIQKKIAERAGVPIYSLVEYGKGHAHVAALLIESPPAGNVYVNSRLPASAAALEVLLPLASGVVRGH